MSDMNQVLARMEALLDRVEGLLPAPPAEPDWSALAWHWQHNRGRGYLQAVSHPHRIDLDDLHNVDEQKAEIAKRIQEALTEVAGASPDHCWVKFSDSSKSDFVIGETSS